MSVTFLTNEDKDSLDKNIGDLSKLTTTNKESLVDAINEAAQSGGITVETDPTVPDWAKQSTKPTYTAAEVGADSKGTAASTVSGHNTDVAAHDDIRDLIAGLTTRLNTLANSDDTTLDQMSEIVAYIKSNKSLIDGITTGKVNVSDIVNNLTTNVSTKPLSAAQGVALKELIDAIAVPTKVSQLTNDSGYLTQHQDISGLLPRTELDSAIDTALEEAKTSGEFDGTPGVSPTITASKSDKVTTLTITDASGTKTATINDGADGADGKDAALYLTESEFDALTAEELAAYYNAGIRLVFVEDDHENLVPQAISENGAIFYGCGYMTGYRLNSSGGVTVADCAVLTGYIPYTQGAKIRIVGGCNTASQGGCYLAMYDANFSLLKVEYLSAAISGTGGTSVCTEDNVFIYTINSASNTAMFQGAAYIRVSLVPCAGHELAIYYE